MSEKKQKQLQELQVTMPQDIQAGSYANQMAVAHTQEEFVLDFIMATPPVGVVNARVVVSPGHAKRIAAALLENVEKYEKTFGTIAAPATIMPEHSTEH